MGKTTVSAMFAALIEEGAISGERLIGCTVEEILAVESHFNCSLPSTFRDFLRIAGKGAGKLFQGTDIYYPEMLGFQDGARELFAENNMPNPLPPDAKVFLMHQGYIVCFFLPGSDDPAVYQWGEGEEVIHRPWTSFSEFLRTEIASHRKVWPDLN